jgi:hypothetical protein
VFLCFCAVKVPGITEIGGELAEVALTFIPGLVDVPILGRILLVLSPGGGNDLKALEQLQKIADAKKTDRATRVAKNARYVLRASDAMKCVETNLMNGGVLLAIGKALINTVLGRPGSSGPDLLADRIFTCIEEHVLRQDTPRVKREGKFYHRPSRGHGRGRGRF